MSTKIFAVNKFLGLNESPNGSTGLKLGEASKAENFYITDDCKLKTRPGVSVCHSFAANARLAFWQGTIGGTQCLVTVEAIIDNAVDIVVATTDADNAFSITHLGAMFKVSFGENGIDAAPVKIFAIGDSLYIAGTKCVTVGGLFTKESCEIYTISVLDGVVSIARYGNCYAPLILTGCSPAGGGSKLESNNIVTEEVRLQYSADGTSTKYLLPKQISAVAKVAVDNVEITGGEFDATSHTYTFSSAPTEGVNNVEFFCDYSDADIRKARTKFLSMRHCEAYNGSTDTRLFFYGDGTNVCYYTGVPAYGKGLYIPVGNEIAVDSSASAITGMRRHYTRLMAYKTDGAFSINYEPTTLEDGSVIAGFYVHPASRDIGNDMDNQIQTVCNCPRTLCGGTLYEWRHTASYYQDERYAKRIGEQVAETLRATDPAKIVTCDDDAARTYYMFLNDDAGTVLVNRYELDAWTVYTGEAFKNIRFADAFHGNMLFCNDRTVFRFDPDSTFDYLTDGGDPVPIVSTWESGYMAFGADYLRKYSSTLWVSMLPEPSSKMSITVKTDRSDEYMIKSAGRPLFDFGAVDFSNFSFLISCAPKIQRIKLKVKKFVYYKLIFRVDTPGARATVLGYDQEVRFASKVK